MCSLDTYRAGLRVRAKPEPCSGSNGGGGGGGSSPGAREIYVAEPTRNIRIYIHAIL